MPLTNIEIETMSAIQSACRAITKKKDIDWEQRRYEIAKECLAAEMANNCHDYQNKAENVAAAVEYADLLITALRKKV